MQSRLSFHGMVHAHDTARIGEFQATTRRVPNCAGDWKSFPVPCTQVSHKKCCATNWSFVAERTSQSHKFSIHCVPRRANSLV